jgi:Glycosyl hydrolase family 48/Cellulose binding domain/Bacterial Ig domain
MRFSWRHRPRRTALVAAGALVVGGLVTVPVSMAQAATACDVVYTTNDWSTGFTANVTIRNLGDPINGWTLGFAFPGNQRVTQGWSANWSQAANSNQVTATNMSWNASIPTNGSVNIGFNGSYSGTNSKPTSFSINGVTCAGAANQAPTVSITSPANNASFTAPANFTINATASDADGSVTQVEFLRDGMLLSTDTSSPYSHAVSALPVGNYVFQARATDNAGLTATAQISVSVTQPAGPSITATPTSLTVAEGGSGSVNFKLSAQPTANVPVSLSKTGDADITLGASSVTLTTANWNTGVNVPVNAAQDADTTNGTATVTASATGYTAATVTVTEADDDTPQAGTYTQRFLTQYNKIKAPSNGYFSPEGVPYHSVETLIVEAPDHGHETTSEAFSFWLWLEAQYGRVQGDWTPFNNAWNVMEKYIIPAHADQTTGGYNASDPATYAPEADLPNNYPVPLDNNVTVGQDPLYGELQSTYGNTDMYSMHWLLDVDNTYGYGHCGDRTTKPAYINTYQRGPQESVFETVPHPSCETFNFGSSNGFLPLFIQDSQYARQWRYTDAPDADARAIQAAYWALTWATQQNKQSQISATVAKAAKMGDYLRYAMYDKYFKQPGCTSPSCPAGSGKNSSNYLLSWYFAWGGAMDSSWSWKIGSSHNHQGYQNPLAAYVLSGAVSSLTPRSSTAAADWQTSLNRQLQFYQWLQSAEGGIAGGATNSWGGAYRQPPAGTPTFYGMAYDFQPVYHDPPSNQWFGFQAWSMERVAEYYYVTGNATAKSMLDKWVNWALANTTTGANGAYSFPSTLSWTGQPGGNWTSSTTSVNNSGLHVSVVDSTNDVGVAAAYARTLIYYGAKAGNTTATATAKAILDGAWTHQDTRGVSVPEAKADYNRLDDPIYVPSNFSGTMANGDPINSNSTFISIRSWYRNDQDWQKVQAYLSGGAVPTFNYHRFWAQSDIAMAMADYAKLVNSE